MRAGTLHARRIDSPRACTHPASTRSIHLTNESNACPAPDKRGQLEPRQDECRTATALELAQRLGRLVGAALAEESGVIETRVNSDLGSPGCAESNLGRNHGRNSPTS
mgnify:CR=1 FL=1